MTEPTEPAPTLDGTPFMSVGEAFVDPRHVWAVSPDTDGTCLDVLVHGPGAPLRITVPVDSSLTPVKYVLARLSEAAIVGADWHVGATRDKGRSDR